MSTEAKWNRIYSKSTGSEPIACAILQRKRYLLPPQGDAIDVACGLGGNALLLAESGLNTMAIDISSVAIERLEVSANKRRVSVSTSTEAVTAATFAPASADVIVVSNYLDRQLFPALVAALRPSGLLFYQTFVKDKADGAGPGNPDYLLDSNELLNLVAGLRVLYFSDLGQVGDATKGLRNQSGIVAYKPLGV